MFKVIFTDGIDNCELTFKVRENSIAKKWYAEILKNYEIYESDRFTNWGDDSNNLRIKLNDLIEDINKYDHVINKQLNKNYTQQDLNYLHTFFEKLRGEIDQKTIWFISAPTYVKDMLEEFNILIHALEAEKRTKNHPTCVVTFKDRPTIPLTKNDFKHFTFRWQSGTVYINYCHVGKTILDIFKDNDHHLLGIRPQTHYSADFMIKFGPTTPYPFYIIKKIIIHIWLKFQKFNFKNPNIGMIPVADLVEKFDIEKMKKFNKVKSVVCLR
jgi:hypothetical protein